MIKNVGGVEIQAKHTLRCHCGAVVLELDLPDGAALQLRVDPFALGPVPVADAVNHPADRHAP